MAIATAAGAKRVRQALLVATAVATLVAAGASPAFAAKGGRGATGGSTSGASISVPNGTFGGTVVATVSPAGLWAHASCSQNGLTVYEQYVQTDALGNATLGLGPTPLWSSGAASCVASAGSFSSTGKFTAAATTTFLAAP